MHINTCLYWTILEQMYYNNIESESFDYTAISKLNMPQGCYDSFKLLLFHVGILLALVSISQIQV